MCVICNDIRNRKVCGILARRMRTNNAVQRAATLLRILAFCRWRLCGFLWSGRFTLPDSRVRVRLRLSAGRAAIV